MKKIFLEKTAEFEDRIGIRFNQKHLLFNALTHSSYAGSKGKKGAVKNNERLEFFGDAVLKLIVSEYLYFKFSDFDEGQLTKIRAQIISDKVLAKIAKDIDLGNYIVFSYGERNTGGTKRTSNLANAMEALLGACFIDSGLEVTKSFFLGLLEKYESDLISINSNYDYKTIIQEYMQKKKQDLPKYTVIKEEGPEHEKVFVVNIEIINENEVLQATGNGKTKKEAEQNAAGKALDIMQKNS
ncbi:MAG: ribonuclease III [bacterium]|nr:ribonuclease III [bacterium]